MDTIYHRVLQFRCAETGKKFIVVFTREHKTSPFRVVNIVDEGELTATDDSHGSGTEPTLQLLGRSVHRLIAPISSVATSSVQLIRRLLTPAARPSAELPHEEDADDAAPPPDEQGVEAFNINDFDFTGWYCPYCGLSKTEPVHPQFIRCGRCQEYICGARVKRQPDGQTYFRCHDGCGNRGVLTGGSLEALTGLGVDSQRPSRLKAGRRELPAPRKALPSGKKDN